MVFAQIWLKGVVLPTPVCKVLKCIADGEYVFGSRIEFSAWKSGLNGPQWINLLANASESLKKQLWAIYAFDQFVYNIDRHLNNYLYMENTRGHIIVKRSILA
ncbi:phage-like protein [Salmonella enterica subsp. arizonae]|uniref:Phage-like protein n=1 Tax=Salmonella enterica subsp. arizonae TaxID=59203 RepID=A0A379SX06_SALER|nr:phage-like protein [Salmonella enterica subsp. arizonae]